MSLVRQLRTSDGHVAVGITGAGPPLLCLHGVSANRSTWDGVAGRLERRFRVVAPDLIGRGESDVTVGARYRLRDEVRRVTELMGVTDIRQPLIVGHSQGAAIALGVARRTASVAGLVLVNPVTPWSRRPWILSTPGLGRSRLAAATLSRFRKPVTRYILERRVLGPGTAADPELVERYSAAYAAPHRARALLAILTDWEPEELSGWLPIRSVPAVVIAGSEDRRMRAPETTRLADLLGADYVVAAGAGHAVPEERPDLVSTVIRELAGRLRFPSNEASDTRWTQA